MMERDKLMVVAGQFGLAGGIAGIRELGRGNINHTYLVTPVSEAGFPFVLQQVNTRVFPQPELVLANIRVVTDHMAGRLSRRSLPAERQWQVLRILPTREGMDHFIDNGRAFWRALSFIDNSRSFDTVQDLGHAAEVGRGLGIFHSLISDLQADRLADTLPGFHVTPAYLQRYYQVLAAQGAKSSAEVNYCVRFIDQRRDWASLLEKAAERGELRSRPIHGDPKVNNVMIDVESGRAIALVDLDTVKPGLIHYDIGDCLRSSCNLAGEEPADRQNVRFEPEICRAVLQGYLEQAGGSLSAKEYDYIYDAAALIAFELGLRFFTDYLEGGVYFKSRDPEQNLSRALVQFKLAESIEAQEKSIKAIVGDFR